jgi:hypothetical protein
MPVYCHKCGEELPSGSGESPFCPHCGSPQLYLALENQSVETGGDPPPNADGSATTGTLPPPSPRQVEWKTAIRCAAAVAGIGALLSLGALRVELLSPVSFLWIMSASLITIGLYQKRLPTAWVDARVGARIGVVVGLCLALGLGAALAGWGLAARFAFHSMGSFDTQMVQQVQQAIQKSSQSSAPIPAEMLSFIQSPEFRAGIMLAGFAMVSAFLLVLSTLGGAFAGLLRMRRGPA